MLQHVLMVIIIILIRANSFLRFEQISAKFHDHHLPISRVIIIIKDKITNIVLLSEDYIVNDESI